MLKTNQNEKVKILRNGRFLPSLESDGRWKPGQTQPRIQGHVESQWTEDSWLYLIREGDRVVRPLNEIEATSYNVYSYGQWNLDPANNEQIVVCGTAQVVVKHNPESKCTYKVLGQGSLSISSPCTVKAFGHGRVWAWGEAEQGLVIEASGNAMIFVRGTGTDVTTSENAKCFYQVMSPPIKDWTQESPPRDIEPSGNRVGRSLSLAELIGDRVARSDWTHNELKCLHETVLKKGIAPTEQELRQNYVRSGWEALACKPISPQEISPLFSLNAVEALRTVRSWVETGENLDSLVMLFTQAAVTSSPIKSHAIKILVDLAKKGNKQAQIAVDQMVTTQTSTEILKPLLEALWGQPWTSLAEIIANMVVGIYQQEEAIVRLLLSCIERDQKLRFLTTNWPNMEHRDGCVREFMDVVIEFDLMQKPQLRNLIINGIGRYRENTISAALADKTLIAVLAPYSDEEKNKLKRCISTAADAGVLAELVSHIS